MQLKTNKFALKRMINHMLYKKTIDATVEDVIEKIKNNTNDFDFVVRDIFDMAQNFKEHGVKVDDDFTYYSIMICNPKKAYQSIYNKKIRGAILLPPKQIVVYPETNNQTTIAYEAPDIDRLKKIMPDDEEFQKSLYASGQKIITFLDTVFNG